MPELLKRVAYPAIDIIEELPLSELINQTKTLPIDKLVPMELLPINNNSGQSYGYIVYRKTNITIPKNSVIKIEGRVCDTVLVLINGQLKNQILKSKQDLNFGYWRQKDSTLPLGTKEYKNVTLDIVVENWGRVNYGLLPQFNQFKGLCQGNVLINEDVVKFEEAVPLEFKRSWLKGLRNWQKPSFGTGPTLYKAILKVDDPKDTHIDLRNWNKGFVAVNNFVLSRYLKLGPQQTAYLPGPLLKRGDNEILIFEHFEPTKTVTFVEDLVFEEF